MEKFKNENGEVGVMYGGAYENFALSVVFDEGTVLDWIFDPNMIQMVLDYIQVSEYDELDRFVGDIDLCEKIKVKWDKYLMEHYKNILDKEYGGFTPEIENVDVFFLKEGTPFVIIDRNIVDERAYGEAVLATKPLIA